MPRLTAAIEGAFRPDRFNYSHLANRRAVVHWHVVPRYEVEPHRVFAGVTFSDLRVGKGYAPSKKQRQARKKKLPGLRADPGRDPRAPALSARRRPAGLLNGVVRPVLRRSDGSSLVAKAETQQRTMSRIDSTPAHLAAVHHDEVPEAAEHHRLGRARGTSRVAKVRSDER